MPKVKYEFEGDASGAANAARQVQNSFTGIASGVGVALLAVQKLKQQYDELIDVMAKPIGFDVQVQALSGKIGEATAAIDALIAKRREFEEGQAAADLAQQIRMGDIDEETGRGLQTLDAEKKVAMAEARGVADPVERARRQAAVAKEFTERETALRNQGDERKRVLLNEETRRQQQVIEEAERRRRAAEEIPGLQQAAQGALSASESNRIRKGQIEAAQANVEELANARNLNPKHWAASRRLMESLIDPESKDFNPVMRGIMGEQFGITSDNVGMMTPNQLAGAAMGARPLLAKEMDATIAAAPGLQTASTAAAEALKKATGRSALTKEEAASLRTTRLEEAAGMKAGAITATTRAASQFGSLGENIEHRLGLQNLGAAEAAALGKAGQSLAQATKRANEALMQALAKFGDASNENVAALKAEVERLARETADLKVQFERR